MVARARSDSESAPNPDVARCIDAFYAAYVRCFNPAEQAERWLADMLVAGYKKLPRSVPREFMNLPRVSGAKDGNLLKKMIATWGTDTVLRLIDEFFKRYKTDRRIERLNPDVGGLWTVAPYLMVQPPAANGGTRRTASNIEAARRATSPQKQEQQTNGRDS